MPNAWEAEVVSGAGSNSNEPSDQKAIQTLAAQQTDEDPFGLAMCLAAYHGEDDLDICALKSCLNDERGNCTKTRTTAFLFAAEGGSAGAIQLLLDAGAVDVGTADAENGWQALHVACLAKMKWQLNPKSRERTHVEAVKLLLHKGADASAADFAGRQPLYYAAGAAREGGEKADEGEDVQVYFRAFLLLL